MKSKKREEKKRQAQKRTIQYANGPCMCKTSWALISITDIFV